MFKSILVSIFCLPFACCGQIKFPVSPIVKQIGDTTYYELSHSSFYSYFKQKNDSVFIAFEPVKFDQLAAIDTKTKHGYFVIKYKEQVLIKYEIRDGQIEGIGLMYHPNLFGKVHKTPYCQAMFSKGMLNGIASFYNQVGIVEEILLYRKGRFKKYLYHQAARSNTDMKNGNKRARNPFIDHEVIM